MMNCIGLGKMIEEHKHIYFEWSYFVETLGGSIK